MSLPAVYSCRQQLNFAIIAEGSVTMEKYNEFAGVYTLLLTPFNLDRSIDYRGYEEYVDWQSSFKPQHLFAVCGSSEMSALTPEERVKCAGP